VGELRVALRALRRAKYMGFYLSLSMDPSCFSFTDYCEIFFFAESGKRSQTEMELVKEFQFLDDELVFGHQQTELLSLNSCCVVFLKH
jgi:hypothetical protein